METFMMANGFKGLRMVEEYIFKQVQAHIIVVNGKKGRETAMAF